MAANRNSAKGRLIMSMFRFGQALPSPLRGFYRPIYYALIDVIVGVSLPLQTEIGGGFILRHGQGVVISWKSRIGSGCELHQHVTLGEKNNGAPQLGNNVKIGASAILLGGISVGDNASVGAGSVVLMNVPAGCTAVGNPARILPEKGSPNSSWVSNT
jgi:serine acetyltransferase